MASPVHNGLQLVPFESAGAPAAGTWAAGTLMCDSGGAMYRCTVGGTPGTWVAIPAPGGVTISSCEVDFGTTPLPEREFTITDAAVTATSKLIVTHAGNAATGKSADENAMDALVATAQPAAGSFTLYARTLDPVALVQGKFKFNYLVG